MAVAGNSIQRTPPDYLFHRDQSRIDFGGTALEMMDCIALLLNTRSALEIRTHSAERDVRRGPRSRRGFRARTQCRSEVVGEPKGQRDDGQRWVGIAAGWED